MTLAPFFSVVIPLYNKERYIRRALDSVLAQEFDDFELIVIDDGSTDGGAAIVRACGDPRIRLVQQSNAGVSAARNRGIQESRGQWVAFLDADDEWLPGFLSAMRRAIQRFPDAGMCFCDMWFDSWPVAPLASGSPAEPVLITDFFRQVFLKGKGILTGTQAVRRQCFDVAGQFPVGVKVGEDHDMWLRLVWLFPLVHVPQVLCVYHTENSASGWRGAVERPHWHATYQHYKAERRLSQAVVESFDRLLNCDSMRCVLRLREREGPLSALRAFAGRPAGHLQALRYMPVMLAQLISPDLVDSLRRLRARRRSTASKTTSPVPA